MGRTLAWTALALALTGAAVWGDRDVPNGWLTREGPSPDLPAWEWSVCHLEAKTVDKEKARARVLKDLERARRRDPDEGMPEALLATIALSRSDVAAATSLLELAVARPRLDAGDAAAIRSALDLPRATPFEAWERKGAVETARHVGAKTVSRLCHSAARGAKLARAHASASPEEAVRLLLALRALGLRLGAEAVSVNAGGGAAEIVKAADEGLLATAASVDSRAWLAARDELDLLRAVDAQATLAEIVVNLPSGVALDGLPSSPEDRALRQLDRELLRAFLARLLLWGVAGCALAVAIGQLAGSIERRQRPDRLSPVRLLPPSPWTLRDDLCVALGSYGVAVALALLFMHGWTLETTSDAELLRLLGPAVIVMILPAVLVHALVRGRLLAKHRRAWREPARVHLGLTVAVVGVVLLISPFEQLLGVLAGSLTCATGLMIAAAGGVTGERDAALEAVFKRESTGPLVRALALSLALAAAADLLVVLPWRADAMQRYSTARATRLEEAPRLRRECMQALRRSSPDAPRTREEREASLARRR